MATIAPKYFEAIYPGVDGAEGRVFSAAEEASQSFGKKAPVVLDSGELELVADTGASMIGLSLQAASGTTDTQIEYVLILSGAELWSGSSSAAGANSHTTAITSLFADNVSFIASTVSGQTAKTVIDFSDTTNEWITTVAIDPRYTLGDTGGRYIFRWNPAKLIHSDV